MELIVDPCRLSMPETGVYIQAQLGGRFGTYDINHLTTDSLISYLRGWNGNNYLAENMVCFLLGHCQYYPNVDQRNDRNKVNDES